MIQIELEPHERSLLLICLAEYLRLVRDNKTNWNPAIAPQIQAISNKIEEAKRT